MTVAVILRNWSATRHVSSKAITLGQGGNRVGDVGVQYARYKGSRLMCVFAFKYIVLAEADVTNQTHWGSLHLHNIATSLSSLFRFIFSVSLIHSFSSSFPVQEPETVTVQPICRSSGGGSTHGADQDRDPRNRPPRETASRAAHSEPDSYYHRLAELKPRRNLPQGQPQIATLGAYRRSKSKRLSRLAARAMRSISLTCIILCSLLQAGCAVGRTAATVSLGFEISQSLSNCDCLENGKSIWEKESWINSTKETTVKTEICSGWDVYILRKGLSSPLFWLSSSLQWVNNLVQCDPYAASKACI